MGSTVQEDSNVIQNIQCSTTAAAPVTAGPTTTTTTTTTPFTTECPGFFTCGHTMPILDQFSSQSPVTAGPTTTTTVTTTVNQQPSTDHHSPDGDSTGGMVTSDTGMVTTTGATEVTTVTSGSPSPSTNDDIPPTPSTAVFTLVTTTSTTTTPVVTTPVATTPATTTPIPTTLAVSEQQRAACLVAIEADGNQKNKFHNIKQLFQHKKKPFVMN